MVITFVITPPAAKTAVATMITAMIISKLYQCVHHADSSDINDSNEDKNCNNDENDHKDADNNDYDNDTSVRGWWW